MTAAENAVIDTKNEEITWIFVVTDDMSICENSAKLLLKHSLSENQ
jgi:hypothetical protein